MSTNKITSRTWELVTDVKHPETGEELINKEKIDTVLKSHASIKEFAYILHDKDTYTDGDIKKMKSGTHSVGDIKPAHFHVVMRFARAQELDSLSEWFGIDKNFFEKKKGRNSFFDSVLYLTHQSDKEQSKGKFVYSEDEVFCHFEEYSSFHEFVEACELNKEKYGKANICIKDKLRLDVLYNGMSIRQVKKNYPMEYNDDMEGLQKRRGDYLKDAPLPQYRISFYISGSGGAGKGLFSEALARALVDPDGEMSDDEIFCYIGSDSVCFENYDGQPVLIWDDCRHNELFKKLGDRGTIFNVFDTKPKRISQKKKYSQTNLINPINIVNSVEPINGFLDGLAGQYYDKSESRYIEAENDQKAQSYRRFPICINVHPTYYDIHVYEPFFGGEYSVIYKYKYAPFVDMVRTYGSDSKEYKDCCLKALKPVIELFEQAVAILSKKDSLKETDNPEKYINLGTFEPFKDFLEVHCARLRSYFNDVLNDNPSERDVEKIVSGYCDFYGVTDKATIDIIRCEVEDCIRDIKYNTM